MSKIVEPKNCRASDIQTETVDVARPVQRYTLIKWLVGFVCRHHNKIQFFGYEAANVLLVWHRTGHAETSLSGFTHEAQAAFAFLFGSACIYAYHPDRRPAALFYGGVGLILGGVSLVLAGYPLTGISVTLASMETARGGLFALQADLARSIRPASPIANLTLVVGQLAFSFYIVPVNRLCRQFGSLGRFLNDRPFLTGALIKLPLRFEFVFKNLLRGDVVGVVVGLSWMILGDGALAFNDQQLRQSALQMSEGLRMPKQTIRDRSANEGRSDRQQSGP